MMRGGSALAGVFCLDPGYNVLVIPEVIMFCASSSAITGRFYALKNDDYEEFLLCFNKNDSYLLFWSLLADSKSSDFSYSL